MVGGKGNRSNCKTWILAPRESLCARPVARDGNDFGKFNTRPAHKQKTRKINLGRWEEAESQAVDFCWAGKEPVCPRQRVLGSAAAEAVLGVLGATVLGTGHRAPGWAAADAGGSSPLCQGRRAGGEAVGSRGGRAMARVACRSPHAARQEQGRRQGRYLPQLVPVAWRRGGQQIALCHFMWKLETLGCGGDRGGMAI